VEPEQPPGRATLILRAAAEGGERESEELLALLHAELHRLAQRQMGAERPDHTLQPTALLHETWLKLFEGEADAFHDRQHFLATAARAMRQILVDHARSKARAKRGGDWQRVELPDDLLGDGVEELDLVAVDRALEELRRRAPRHAQVVECRFFADLSVDETAGALGISPRTVAREWRFARAWLTEALQDEAARRDPAE